jgi:hypothetical protein
MSQLNQEAGSVLDDCDVVVFMKDTTFDHTLASVFELQELLRIASVRSFASFQVPYRDQPAFSILHGNK